MPPKKKKKKTLTEQNDDTQLQGMKDNQWFETVPCCETLRECNSVGQTVSSNTQLRKLTKHTGFLAFYETKLPILKLTL